MSTSKFTDTQIIVDFNREIIAIEIDFKLSSE